MKITDPQVIEDGEKDLIHAVQEDLDLEQNINLQVKQAPHKFLVLLKIRSTMRRN